MRFIYFLKNLKFDLLATASAVLAIFLSYVWNDNKIFLAIISLISIFLALVVIIYLRARDKEFYFISLTSRKHKDDFIGWGDFGYDRTQKCYSITNADPGYIYSKTLSWSDYKFKFDFKFINSCLGVVVRANNLYDYIMLQINQKGIRPHIRLNGAWRIWEAQDVNLVFESPLSLDSWYKCEIICEKRRISIKIIEKGNILFEREWIMPFGHLIFEFRDPNAEAVAPEIKIPLIINLDYGSVGFRNSGTEKALIKNILIKKIKIIT